MNPQLARVAKRIVIEMVKIVESQTDLRLFTGYGLALAFIFEEITGKKVNEIRINPKELMKWALELPIETKKEVTLQ